MNEKVKKGAGVLWLSTDLPAAGAGWRTKKVYCVVNDVFWNSPKNFKFCIEKDGSWLELNNAEGDKYIKINNEVLGELYDI